MIRRTELPSSFHRCQKVLRDDTNGDERRRASPLSSLSFLETTPQTICYRHLYITPWDDQSDDRYMQAAGLQTSREALLLFRRNLFKYLGLNTTDYGQLAPNGELRVLVYDRLDAPYNHINGGKRALLNGKEVAEWMENKNMLSRKYRHQQQQLPFNATRVHVTYLRSMSSLSWVSQVHLFHDTDILIAPHGAHMTNTIFMPLGAAIIEMSAQCGKIKSFLGKYHTIAALGHRYD